MVKGRYGITLQGFVPLRKEPCEQSEMISQVVFGEQAEILEEKGSWLFVRTPFDNYEGWLDAKTMQRTDRLGRQEICIASRNFSVRFDDGDRMQLPAGSVVPFFEGDAFTLGGREFILESPGDFRKPGDYSISDLIPGIIGVPYIWGGRSGFGFDCSGLVQYLCRAMGVNLPRDAGDQAAIGKTLGFIGEIRPGDLAFFDNTEGIISHVGMVSAEGRILHASGRVRIDKLDQQGIFNTETRTYTYKLRVMKRVF